MESSIHTINTIQDIFAIVNECELIPKNIDLPQIVVVGSQNCGKSSVLESMIGKSFLPHSKSNVLRAPLILQMIRYNNQMCESMLKLTIDDSIEEWACFLHKPDTVFHNFDEVRVEIESRTNELARNNKGIIHHPIVLKVYTLLYDLTLIDLPGITKIPVGDQPKDIDKQIKRMILKYIEQPNTIILTVITANSNPTTSESLQMARKVDPNGTRTIAVVTKLDLIDESTIHDIKEFLYGNTISVKLGIIGIVNRSQKDINEKKCMEEALRSEQEFLKTIYKNHGSKVLISRLEKMLLNHINKTYPTLCLNLRDNKVMLENKLKTLLTHNQKFVFISGLIKDISKSYCDMVKGTKQNIFDKVIMGSAKISDYKSRIHRK